MNPTDLTPLTPARALREALRAPTTQAFRDAWTHRTFRTSLSRVHPSDLSAYLRRNAPSGPHTLHLFRLSDPPTLLGVFDVQPTPGGHRHFTPPLPDVAPGPVAAIFTGPHETVLFAVLDPAPPATIHLGRAALEGT